MTDTINENLSFQEMLDQSFKTLNTGERVTGIISAVNPAEVKVDLGTKHTGILPYDEITAESGVNLNDLYKVGDEIEVFVYHDSEDRLVPTTDKPLITEGRAAYLKVVDKNIHGAFLDWGISGKDLFLPNRNQQGGVLAGRSYVVWLYVDNITGRCVATMKLKPFIDNDIITVKPRQKVDILIASESPIGYRAIIDSRHWGMVYKNQIFQKVQIGDRFEGFVRRITASHSVTY